MDIILISSPGVIENEIEQINRMFEQGLSLFHLRKPDYTIEQLKKYVLEIDPAFHSRIAVHYHFGLTDLFDLGGIHISGRTADKQGIIESFKSRNMQLSCSFHSLGELTGENKDINYAFLSPVFDSISKKNYKRKFDYNELKIKLNQATTKIIALGGCSSENLIQVKELGFSGAAFLGAVWNTSDPFGSFINIKETAEGH